jgi:hypothetical protein
VPNGLTTSLFSGGYRAIVVFPWNRVRKIVGRSRPFRSPVQRVQVVAAHDLEGVARSQKDLRREEWIGSSQMQPGGHDADGLAVRVQIGA